MLDAFRVEMLTTQEVLSKQEDVTRELIQIDLQADKD
jgi:hypothetical protein